MSGDSYKIHRIGLVNVSSYLIHRPGEAILVDSGSSGSEEKILETLQRLGLEPNQLKLLVLTHSHFDHAGSAGRLKELTACKVMVHRSEAERLRKGYSPIPAGTRWKAKLLVPMDRWWFYWKVESSLPGIHFSAWRISSTSHPLLRT